MALASLLSKMGVDRMLSAKIKDARDALQNIIIDMLRAYKKLFGSNAPNGQVRLVCMVKRQAFFKLRAAAKLKGGTPDSSPARSFLPSGTCSSWSCQSR